MVIIVAVALMITRVCGYIKKDVKRINSTSWQGKLIRLVGRFDTPYLHCCSCVKSAEYIYQHIIHVYTNYVSSIFSTLQTLLMLKVTLSKDGAIYFGEISLFLVNPSSLIAGFKSSPQITYLITIEHNPELESLLISLILLLSRMCQISLLAMFLNMLYVH